MKTTFVLYRRAVLTATIDSMVASRSGTPIYVRMLTFENRIWQVSDATIVDPLVYVVEALAAPGSRDPLTRAALLPTACVAIPQTGLKYVFSSRFV
jgi:hypothetical protein